MLYAGLFIFAQYPSPVAFAAALPTVGMILMLALIVCRILPLQWVRAGARWLLAEMLLFCPCRGGCGELCTIITGGWLAYFCRVIALSTVMVLGTTAVVEKSIAMKCAG
ncbi:murein hydrolase regulator LrgA [Escherichia coli]|nr:murein hydrolase regulator LrgA [Escherichia coli]